MSRRLPNIADHPLSVDISNSKCSYQWLQNYLSWNRKPDICTKWFEHLLPRVLPREPDLVSQGTADNYDIREIAGFNRRLKTPVGRIILKQPDLSTIVSDAAL